MPKRRVGDPDVVRNGEKMIHRFDTARLRLSAPGPGLVIASMMALVAMLGVGPATGWLSSSATLTSSATEAGIAPLGPATQNHAISASELARRAAIKVVGRNCGARTAGTGFLIATAGTTAVVTNHHVVGPAGRIHVRTSAGEIDVAVVRSDPGRDLAVGYMTPAQAEAVGSPTLGVAVPPPIGQRLVLAGYPGGGHLEVGQGTVQTTVPGAAYGFDADVVLVNGGAAPGMSGGPVLDEFGSLIGIVAAVDYTTGLVVAVSSSELLALLSSDMGEGFARPQPTC